MPEQPLCINSEASEEVDLILALRSLTSGGKQDKQGWLTFSVTQCSKLGRNSCWMGCAITPRSDVNLKCWFCQALPAGVCTRRCWGLQGRVRVCPGLLLPSSITDPQKDLSEGGGTSVKRKNPVWQEGKMWEKQPQLLEKSGWTWFSWQAGAVACRAHTGAWEKCEEERAVKRKCTLWLQSLTPHPPKWGRGTGDVGAELSLAKDVGRTGPVLAFVSHHPTLL